MIELVMREAEIQRVRATIESSSKREFWQDLQLSGAFEVGKLETGDQKHEERESWQDLQLLRVFQVVRYKVSKKSVNYCYYYKL